MRMPYPVALCRWPTELRPGALTPRPQQPFITGIGHILRGRVLGLFLEWGELLVF
jgi:hypothetical protein